ncbi:MAG: VWA domain-containing protein, partial [Deltaproteobacteria bacterium]|nr:VWA domain-containing protein [Deltaproteobacteria bacterium]
MKRHLKIIVWLLVAFLFIFPAPLRADDTEIYGTVGVSLEPNVLIIFDTSGSMGTVDVVAEIYDPATTYPVTYPTNAVYYLSGWWWWQTWNLLADDVNTICPGARDLLLSDGYGSYSVKTDGTCGGTSKSLRLGNYRNYEAAGLGDKDSRINVAKTVVKELINTTSNVRFGLMRFNDSQGGRIVKECGTSASELITAVDALSADDWTPLGETLAEAGLYFAGMSSWFNSGVTYTSPMQERCQKNYIILMTDGEPTQDNDSKLSSGTYINGDTIGDYDGDGHDPGSYSS